ncbi:hypothetical protein CC79DRAFT_1386517 [Sarocladium strictum]
MSLPRPELSRFHEVYKSLPLRSQKKTNGETYHEESYGNDNQDKGHGVAPAPSPTQGLEDFLANLVSTPAGSHRPFIFNLNGDGSMLIAIPRPQTDVETLGKAFYYLVTDPWLDGSADFLGEPMFMSLAHLEDPIYRSIAAVELTIRAIENAALGQSVTSPSAQGSRPRPGIDGIIISAQLSDHLHQPTLIQGSSQVPILAAEDTVGILKLLDHFDNIWTIPNLGIGDSNPLPRWLNVLRLPDAGGFTHGILITWTATQSTRPAGILYAPHGVSVETVQTVLVKSPTVRLLAMLHPVNETFTEGAPNALGVDSGLRVYRATNAQVWIQTHDPDFERSGILAQFQAFHPRSIEEALEASPGPKPNFRPRINGGIYQM